MARWSEVKARWQWLCDNLELDEPVVFKLPRREARKRIINKDQKRRIIMSTDPQNYAEFMALREAYMRYCDENPTQVMLAITEAMKCFDLKGWLETQLDERKSKQEDDFMMGRESLGDA